MFKKMLILACLLSWACAASAVEIKYTPFYPNRMNDPGAATVQKFGQPWQWPLKTFPNSWRNPAVKDLGDSYGLVYWPGEKVQINASPADVEFDRVTCVNVLDPTDTLPAGRVLEGNVLTHEYWENLPGSKVSDLTSSEKFRGKPDGGLKSLQSFDVSSLGDNYGSRVRGFIVPKVSGEYTFFIASDDQGELWLSTDEDPANKVKVASVPEYTQRREWDKYPEQRSEPIALKAGQKYYVEALQKEGGGMDFVSVAWQGPEFKRQVITAEYLKPWDKPIPTRQWQIAIPKTDQKAPYLKVYRVHAYVGGKEVASRGLIVTIPFSGTVADGDPNGFAGSRGEVLHEWFGGVVSPATRMVMMFGNNPTRDDIYPLGERPYGEVGACGLAEIYGWPRSEQWLKYNPEEYTSNRRAFKHFTSKAYKDPSLEWNTWWVYYGRGVSKWHGQWEWGPFSSMCPEEMGREDYDYGVCYGDVKKYCAAYPNGMLFWQWHWAGLERMLAHITKYNNPDQRPKVLACSDGWAANSLPFAMRRFLNYSQEVGSLPLYYQRCRYYGLDTAWTQKYNSIGSFVDAQFKDTLDNNNRTNDYCIEFCRMDLDTKGTALLGKASRRAYEQVTGKNATFFCRHFSALDYNASGGMFRDFRPVNDKFFTELLGLTDTGGDYAHYSIGRGNDYYNRLRIYRGYGYAGALICAMFPDCHYGYGYNQMNWSDDITANVNGSIMPGTIAWKERTAKFLYHDNFGINYQKRLRYLDDGTSFRRFDMSERIPMFARKDGTFTGCDVAQTGAWVPSLNSLWNTQALLGMQVAEIPDRTKPIGGVLVFDSNNKADRQQNQEFLTDHSFAGYLAAVLDSLGIDTYVNPDIEPKLPSDLARVYAPKMDGDQAYLMAEVGGQTIKVPYTGEQMQDPNNPGFQSFVDQIKAAYPGGWPIRTTGGFVATAWESSKGTFVYVENPIDARKPGTPAEAAPAGYEDEKTYAVLHDLIARRNTVVHVPRKGSVTVRVAGFNGKPAVVDLCGNEPDPHRLAESAVHANGEWITFDLDWQRGDARLFWITKADE